VLEEDSIQNWMLSTLLVNNIISENKSVHNRIVLESIPSNGEYLQTVIDAMKKNTMVRFTYHKYSSTETTDNIVEPYLVKLFHRRWYMICRYPETSQFRTFSFDRMLNLESSDIHFKMDKKFEAIEYFEDCFGIVKDDETPVERVVVRAYEKERYYLRDLPLHPTQRLINRGDGFVDYECKLKPTLDFMGYLLSRGSFVKVIAPQWVADKVKQMHMDATKRYEE
jgi:predicted DNA-binding transcriptional regulator YafY